MGRTRGLGFAAVLAGGFALTGCANCFENAPPAGFLAPRLHHRHAAAAQSDVLAPAPVSTNQTALSKCNQKLYLEAFGSQEDIHTMEDKCRALILSQPY